MPKKAIVLFVLTEIILIVAAGFLTTPVKTASKERRLTVVIDAGHGGIDGGATGVTSGVNESTINLAIAKKLKERLLGAGLCVVMTRSGEGGLYGIASSGFKKRDLDERVKIVNGAKADIFVSVHLNKFSDGTRRGAQVFFRKGDENSKLLAEKLQQSLNSMKEAVKKTSPLAGDYYVLNETSLPAVICECGFLSNAEDEKLLLTDSYQAALAEAVFEGITDYLAAKNSA